MFFTDPVTIILSIATLILIAIIYRPKEKVHPNYPPGPPHLPFVGNLHIIDINNIYGTLEELAKKYGSVYSIKLGSQKIVVLCGYETVKDALINHAEEFSARPDVPIFTDATKGHGLLMSNGDTWKTMRRFTLSTLRDLGVGNRKIEDRIIEECENLVEKIKTHSGKPFDTTMILNVSVANIMMPILLGCPFDYANPNLRRLLTMSIEGNWIVGTPMVALYNAFPAIFRWLPGNHKTFLAYVEEVYSLTRGIFMKQKDHLDFNDIRSFLEPFIVRQKEEKNEFKKHFSDENLIVLVVDLFAAGVHTTSATLEWGLLLMAKYSEVQEKVQDEIKKVIGFGSPCSAHQKQMPYTNAVIHEIQRFANVVPMGGPHATTQDVTLKGFFIPKGTQIITLLYSVLRDKKYFERAEEFYPQHFLDVHGNFVTNEAFMPFAGGKRKCVGEKLAKIELFFLFTTLLQNFTFQAAPGAKLDLRYEYGFITPPVKQEICAIPRCENDANI